MSQRSPDHGRRRFLRRVAAGTIAAPVASLLPNDGGAAASPSKLDPQSGQAKALSYVHDASHAEDNPAYRSGAHCANCLQWTGGSSTWGGCKIFPDSLVHRNGWCSAWAEA